MELKPLDDYRDALKQAIKREEDAMDFYEKAAAVVHQADQKALLKRLSMKKRGTKRYLLTLPLTLPRGRRVLSSLHDIPSIQSQRQT